MILTLLFTYENFRSFAITTLEMPNFEINGDNDCRRNQRVPNSSPVDYGKVSDDDAVSNGRTVSASIEVPKPSQYVNLFCQICLGLNDYVPLAQKTINKCQ